MILSDIKIGDCVQSKQTGTPGCGYVIGIMTPGLFCGWNHKTYNDYDRWTRLYKNWTQKPIIVVYFTKARKPLTFGELKESYSATTPTDKLLESYNKIPETHIIGYPMDDLNIVFKDT